MQYHVVPLVMFLTIFFSTFIFVSTRWVATSKSVCVTSPLIISDTLRDDFSRLVLSLLLASCALLFSLSFSPIKINETLIILVFLCLTLAFIFYVKFVHEVLVTIALFLGTLIVFKDSLGVSLLKTRVLRLLLLLLLVLFIVLYIALDVKPDDCTWIGALEFVLLVVLFVALFLNRLQYIRLVNANI